MLEKKQAGRGEEGEGEPRLGERGVARGEDGEGRGGHGEEGDEPEGAIAAEDDGEAADSGGGVAGKVAEVAEDHVSQQETKEPAGGEWGVRESPLEEERRKKRGLDDGGREEGLEERQVLHAPPAAGEGVGEGDEGGGEDHREEGEIALEEGEGQEEDGGACGEREAGACEAPVPAEAQGNVEAIGGIRAEAIDVVDGEHSREPEGNAGRGVEAGELSEGPTEGGHSRGAVEMEGLKGAGQGGREAQERDNRFP